MTLHATTSPSVSELQTIHQFAKELGQYDAPRVQHKALKSFLKHAFSSSLQDYVFLQENTEIFQEWRDILNQFQPVSELPDIFNQVKFVSSEQNHQYVHKTIQKLNLPISLDYDKAKFIPDFHFIMASVAHSVGSGKSSSTNTEFIVHSYNYGSLCVNAKAFPSQFIKDLQEIETLSKKFSKSKSVQSQLSYNNLLEQVKKNYPIKEKMNAIYIEDNLFLF